MNSLEHCSPLKPLQRDDGTIATVKNPFRIGLSVLRQQWQQAIVWLTQAQALRVWQRTDRAGRVYWQAYDPVTGRSTTGSEADIRAWIEHLHYLNR